MCALFNKKHNNRPIVDAPTLSDDDKNKIIQQMYKLGFEVGYNHHSEVGWVKSSYTKLIDISSDESFQSQLNNYYVKGKFDGIEKKKLDLRNPVAVVKSNEPKPTPYVEPTPFIDSSRSSNKATRQYAPTAHVSMTSEPAALNRPIVIDLPSSLSGFKPLKPHKEEDK